MPFCPKCKALMLPKDGKFVCPKCGENQDTKTAKKTSKRIVTSEQQEKETVLLEDKPDILPKTKALCPKCGHNEAFWVIRQTRASDEPETRIYTCTKCNHRWREY